MADWCPASDFRADDFLRPPHLFQALVSNGEWVIAAWYDDEDGWHSEDGGQEIEIERITHFMPYPEPPAS